MSDRARLIRIVTRPDAATGKRIARSPELQDLAVAELHDSDLRYRIEKGIVRLLSAAGHKVIVVEVAGFSAHGMHSAWVAVPADEAQRQLEMLSAVAQRESGTATVTDRFPDSGTPKIDVREVVASTLQDEFV